MTFPPNLIPQNSVNLEIVIILGTILLLFSAKKTPNLVKGIRQGIENFVAAMKDIDGEIKIENEMPSITIYASATHESQRNQGCYNCTLIYFQYEKTIHKIISCENAMECMLNGLIDALNITKEPCNINIVTATKMDLGDMSASYRNTLTKLLNISDSKSCKLSFTVNAEDKMIRETLMASEQLLFNNKQLDTNIRQKSNLIGEKLKLADKYCWGDSPL